MSTLGAQAGAYLSEPQANLMLARYYSSSLGRFMAVDPGYDTQPENPQSWNRYTYVRNNPVRYVDPRGTATQDTKKLYAEASSNSNATKGEASAGVLKGKTTGAAGSAEVKVASVNAEVHQGSTVGASAEGSVLSGKVEVGKPDGVAKAEGEVKLASASAEGGAGASATTEKLGMEGKAGLTAALAQGSASGTISVPFLGSTTLNITIAGDAGVGVSVSGHAGGYLGTGGFSAGAGVKIGAPLFVGGSIGVSVEPQKASK